MDKPGIGHPLRRALRVVAPSLLIACAPNPSTTPTPAYADDDARSLGAPVGAPAEGPEAVDRRRATSFEQLLVGVRGLQVMGTGHSLRVRVRGSGTLPGGGDPLYIVDGVMLPGGTRNAVTLIDPAHVAHIQVLRAGPETAVYGGRGNNGVIVVTTKRARGH